jgi:arsenite oxidase small subunit
VRPLQKASRSEPLWREEFSVRKADERYVNRRQLTKFLTLTSLAMFAGNVWIAVRSWFRTPRNYPAQVVAASGEIPVRSVKLFAYPTPADRCIMVRTGDDTYAAYSQKCTHLSCAVFYSAAEDRIECPCHNGIFSVKDGSVVQGPPARPLPRILLERRGEDLVAVGVDENREEL